MSVLFGESVCWRESIHLKLQAKSLLLSLSKLLSDLFTVKCDTDDREHVLHTAQGYFFNHAEEVGV